MPMIGLVCIRNRFGKGEGAVMERILRLALSGSISSIVSLR
jgi:hypothetical protein